MSRALRLSRYDHTVDAVADLSDRLRAHADPAKRDWWERYLKGAISFYGVPMGEIRRIVRTWAADRDGVDLREVSIALLSEPVAEQKLSGILIMGELLLPSSELDPDRDLPAIAAVFDDGRICDWNTTDWLCMKVLGPMIESGGRRVADEVATWVDAPGLWRRRCAAVAFVPVASRGDAEFDGQVEVVLGVCASNIRDEARFAQTGVGWVLRELSDAARHEVYGFIVEHREQMSREAVRMAAARLSDDQRAKLGLGGKRTRR